MQNVAILTTVKNDRERILSVLENCFIQIDEMKNVDNYNFTIYLLDNESTDGTFDEVKEKFPQVKITRQDVSDEWKNGMNTIWSIATQDNPDFFLWLDYKIDLKEKALACIMETSEFLRDKAIIAGTIENNIGSSCIYGGINKSGKTINPDNILPTPCVTFDGMLVLVPRYVWQTIGQLDPAFKLKYADREYGVRAMKKGITRVIAPKILGTYECSCKLPVWRDSSYPLKTRYNSLNRTDGCPPREKFLYDLKRAGILTAIGYNISIWVRMFFPKRRKEIEQ